MISVVVPVRAEPPPPAAFLEPLRRRGVELIVAADAQTPTASLAAWEEAGARVTSSAAPRGARLSAAARTASGEIVLFLHADTILPTDWDRDVVEAISSGAVAGAFRLSFSGGGPRMAFVAWWARLRTAVTRVPYGDQAPFVARSVYERLGGHAPWPLLEDVELFTRLREEGRIALLTSAVVTSPRRYLERGVARTVLGNWRTLLRWRAGVPPEELAREYRRTPGKGLADSKRKTQP